MFAVLVVAALLVAASTAMPQMSNNMMYADGQYWMYSNGQWMRKLPF
jgi:hypothetical protein